MYQQLEHLLKLKPPKVWAKEQPTHSFQWDHSNKKKEYTQGCPGQLKLKLDQLLLQHMQFNLARSSNSWTTLWQEQCKSAVYVTIVDKNDCQCDILNLCAVFWHLITITQTTLPGLYFIFSLYLKQQTLTSASPCAAPFSVWHIHWTQFMQQKQGIMISFTIKTMNQKKFK